MTNSADTFDFHCLPSTTRKNISEFLIKLSQSDSEFAKSAFIEPVMNLITDCLDEELQAGYIGGLIFDLISAKCDRSPEHLKMAKDVASQSEAVLKLIESETTLQRGQTMQQVNILFTEAGSRLYVFSIYVEKGEERVTESQVENILCEQAFLPPELETLSSGGYWTESDNKLDFEIKDIFFPKDSSFINIMSETQTHNVFFAN